MAWKSPTGNLDPNAGWNTETNAYDEDTATSAYSNLIANGIWTKQLTLTIDSLSCDKVRIYLKSEADSLDYVQIYVEYNSSWHSIYEGNTSEDVWVECPLADTYDVTGALIQLYNETGSDNKRGYIGEFDFHEVELANAIFMGCNF